MTFREYVRAYKSVWGLAAAAVSAGPLALWATSDFAPPWPSDSATSALVTTVSIVAFLSFYALLGWVRTDPTHDDPRAPGQRLRVRALGFCALALAALSLYCYAGGFSMTVVEEKVRRSGETRTVRIVVGTVRLSGLPDKAKRSDRDILADFGFAPDSVWTQESLQSARMRLLVSYSCIFLGLTGFVACMATLRAILERG